MFDRAEEGLEINMQYSLLNNVYFYIFSLRTVLPPINKVYLRVFSFKRTLSANEIFVYVITEN